ncbi:MAG: endonuclease MutS2 [Thermoanaerobacteraceae bacterium]
MNNIIKEKYLLSLEFDKIIKLIADNCSSLPGKELVYKTKICKDISKINEKLDFLNEVISYIFSYGSFSFQFEDIRDFIKKAEKGSILTNKEFLTLKEVLNLISNAKIYLKNTEGKDKYPQLFDYKNSLILLQELKKSIETIILSEDEISDDASVVLKNLRRQKLNINDKIRNTLNSIISARQKELQEPIITIREGRYVVPIKQEYRSSFKGLIHDQSSSGATLFIEPIQVVELNNELKQIDLKEKQEIYRILSELSEKVRNNSEVLYLNVDILTKLDEIFAKAKYAIQINGTKPELNNLGYINLKNARHPLIDPKNIVPISVNIGDKFNTLIITGPNTGGKTVTLKTIGLLTIMAMAGLNIPADDKSEISIFDKVFVDVGDEQSIEQSLSTFSSHMVNIVDILNNVNDKSLVLLDELGAGTDPTEGAALAMSILDFLHKKNAITIATTHYSELKQYALKTEGVENASVEFDISTLKPTYKLFIGIPGKSNAFEISKKLGLSENIISNARKYINEEALKFEDIINDLEQKRIEAEKSNSEIILLKKEIQELKKELEKERKNIEGEKEKIIESAREKAQKILNKARETSNEIIQKIKEAEKAQNKNKLINEAREKLKNSIEDIGESVIKKKDIILKEVPKDVKVGQSVYIVPLDQNGIVLSKPDKSGNVEIQAGILKMNVHISNLRVSAVSDQTEKMKGYTKFFNEKSQNILSSIDLRGKNLDEAEMETEKYIDDAYLSGLKQVTIIHGKGTGILRDGISQILKKNKYVKSYRLGIYGEGGDGVTIVELKEK